MMWILGSVSSVTRVCGGDLFGNFKSDVFLEKTVVRERMVMFVN